MIWLHQFFHSIFTESNRNIVLEDAGIDPTTSRMQSALSTIWANVVVVVVVVVVKLYLKVTR